MTSPSSGQVTSSGACTIDRSQASSYRLSNVHWNHPAVWPRFRDITWWWHQWRHKTWIDYPWGPYRHTTKKNIGIMELSLLRAFAPGSESSMVWNFEVPRIFAPWNFHSWQFCSRERKSLTGLWSSFLTFQRMICLMFHCLW